MRPLGQQLLAEECEVADKPGVIGSLGSNPTAAQRRLERLRGELEAARAALRDAWIGYSDYPAYRAVLVAARGDYVRLLEDALRREMTNAA
jgi:hypothetical protein